MKIWKKILIVILLILMGIQTKIADQFLSINTESPQDWEWFHYLFTILACVYYVIIQHNKKDKIYLQSLALFLGLMSIIGLGITYHWWSQIAYTQISNYIWMTLIYILYLEIKKKINIKRSENSNAL